METQVNISNTEYSFDVLMENQASKIASNALVATAVLIFTPLYYFVVWFERSGHNNKRTLIIQVLPNFKFPVSVLKSYVVLKFKKISCMGETV